MKQNLLCAVLRAATVTGAVVLAVNGGTILAHANVRVSFPADVPGPPFYAFLERPPLGEIFRDGDWAAIPFIRDPSCIPSTFNLLDADDLTPAFGSVGPPRSFLAH